ncbi:MAG: DUF3047 domain-containing protein [Pseudomonadota bacterium]
MKHMGLIVGALLAAVLAACSAVPPPAATGVVARLDAPPAWQHFTLPGKRSTHYSAQRMDAREVVHARADGSASLWRQQLRVAPDDMGLLHFSWKVPGLIANADMAVRETDDSPVRIVLAFDGDRSKLSSKSQALSDLARALTGEELPYATLMYVWSNAQPTESLILNPRTDRIRKIVVESGDGQLNQWLDYTRDVRADYERAFGEAPGALLSVALMTDADNTQSQTVAWYGPVKLNQR